MGDTARSLLLRENVLPHFVNTTDEEALRLVVFAGQSGNRSAFLPKYFMVNRVALSVE